MDNNVIEVTGISESLLNLIDERIGHEGGDRAAYVRDLIEKDIYSVSTQSSRQKRLFDLQAWETDMKFLAEASEVPILPPEAFTRESIYRDHD